MLILAGTAQVGWEGPASLVCPSGGRGLYSAQLGSAGRFCLETLTVPATIITLQCGQCRERNYTTQKNKRNDPDRLELRKYCRRCRQHTAHRETK